MSLFNNTNTYDNTIGNTSLTKYALWYIIIYKVYKKYTFCFGLHSLNALGNIPMWYDVVMHIVYQWWSQSTTFLLSFLFDSIIKYSFNFICFFVYNKISYKTTHKQKNTQIIYEKIHIYKLIVSATVTSLNPIIKLTVLENTTTP